MSAKQHKIRVGISIGDFNGIGPEIIIKTLKEKSILDFFHTGNIRFRKVIFLPKKRFQSQPELSSYSTGFTAKAW